MSSMRFLGWLLVAMASVVGGMTDRTLAGGSVALSDVLSLTRGVPDLEPAVNKAAEDADEQVDGIACEATRLGNQYALIGGSRIGPYNCPIGDKVLEVESQVDFLDEGGNVIDKSEDEGQRAAGVREKDFKWTLRPRNK